MELGQTAGCESAYLKLDISCCEFNRSSDIEVVGDNGAAHDLPVFFNMAKYLYHQRHDGAAGKMAGVPGEGVGRETEVAADELRPRLAQLIGRESTGICKLYECETGRKTYYGEIASTESGSSSGPGAGAPAGACAGAWAGLCARPQVVRNRRRDGTRSSMTVSSVVRRNGCANLGNARLDEIILAS